MTMIDAPDQAVQRAMHYDATLEEVIAGIGQAVASPAAGTSPAQSAQPVWAKAAPAEAHRRRATGRASPRKRAGAIGP